MGIPLLLGVFAAQAVTVVIIVVILKKVLNIRLINMALRSFEAAVVPESAAADTRVVVISHRPLTEKVKSQIKTVAVKHFGVQAALDYQLKPDLWGGVIIQFGKTKLDCSLKDRLDRAITGQP